MADRFPIILNTNTNQLQELPSGDILDLTGSGIKSSGITTYTTSAQLNLGGGTNINTGTRGDILFYNSSNTIQKLSLGSSGKVLKSNGTDLVYGDSGQTANVYYVSTSGQDASGRGGSVDTAYRSIKYACANISTPTATNPAIIFVKAGTYEEASLPIVVPAFTTIAGDSLRATIVKPASGLDSGGSIQNNRSTLFRMSNATVLQDLVMDGMGGYTPGSPAYKPENATIGGTYLALNAASVISTKSPYIYNCTSFGNGATGAVLDGALHSSGNRSMLFHTYTAVHSDGLGILLKANANAEMISTFTYYCTVGFACLGGSKIRSLNSSNAYGEYAVYSAGFDTGESANQGTVKGTMLTYTNVLTQDFTAGEQITGGTSSATAYVVNVQAEPKRMYIVQKSGTFQANETVTGGSSGATATLAAASFETNQSGRILVTTFSSSADAGDSLQFASTDGNAYQIQSVSSVTANSVAYHVLVFSTSRATPVPTNTTVNVRKEFSLIRLTGHDFLQVGTGGTDTTNWPNNPTQNPAQADQVITNETDPGRVYYTATDELGNFYVGDQFKVDQATGNVTLDASAFNLSGLESLRLGSVGGLIGAAVGEFSTDTTLSQNSDTKVPTQKAVKTYVDTLDDITPLTGLFTLAGISTVTGTTLFSKQLNVSGVSTFHGNVNLLDGDRLRIGSSEDLQVYHDGNHSYIAENGAGDLKIQASAGSILLQRDNGHEMIKANVGGSVDLYHNDTLRFATTSDGASVTGNLAVSGVLTYEDVTNVDSVGIVTARKGIRAGGNTAITGTPHTYRYGRGGEGGGLSIYASEAAAEIVSDDSGGHGSSFLLRSPTEGFGFNHNPGTNSLDIKSFTSSADNFTIHDPSGTDVSSVKDCIRMRKGSSVSLYHNGVGVVTTTSSGATINQFIFDNTGITRQSTNSRIVFHNSNETRLYHAANAQIKLAFRGNGDVFRGAVDAASGYIQLKTGSDESAVVARDNGFTELYYNGNKKLNTENGGVFITGICTATAYYGDGSNLTGIVSDKIFEGDTEVECIDTGSGGEVTIKADNTDVLKVIKGSEAHIPGKVGINQFSNRKSPLTVAHTHASAVQVNLSLTSTGVNAVGGGTAIFMKASNDLSAERRYGTLIKSERSSNNNGSPNFIIEKENAGATGLAEHFRIDAAGQVLPGADNTQNLGSSTKRWANIYSADIHCSNKGSSNDVDGTWGDFTIQEGESDLFLINNRSGKKYKFNLTEVN